METTIHLSPSELNSSMLDMVKSLVEKSGFTSISINLTDNKPLKSLRKESKKGVNDKIEKAIKDIQSNNTNDFISFSAEEFEQFSRSLQKK